MHTRNKRDKSEKEEKAAPTELEAPHGFVLR